MDIEVGYRVKQYKIYEYTFKDWWLVYNEDITDFLVWYKRDDEKEQKLYRFEKDDFEPIDLNGFSKEDQEVIWSFWEKVNEDRKRKRTAFKVKPGRWECWA